MPSLVLTGHPCTGKTTFAHLLGARALNHPSRAISRIVHIRESTACPDRTKSECYSDSHSEKTTRAALKSEFDRAVVASSNSSTTAANQDNGGSGSNSSSSSSGTLVILDSLNYIKGYRYELYCISKAAGERHGVVWVMGDKSDGECLDADGKSRPSDVLAKKRNRDRKELEQQQQQQVTSGDEEKIDNSIMEDGYYEDDGTMDALVLRYEPPDEKNRWENPLYKVNVRSVLPWGKDGTMAQSSDSNDVAPKSSGVKHEKSNEPVTDQMKSMDLKDAPTQKSVPSKPAKKSASGFKRRGKKSSQQGSTTTTRQQSQTTPPPTTATPNTATIQVPSSMASRNRTANSNGDNNTTQQSRMEDVIDTILDSFLTNIAPLKEGMSTIQHVSAASNVLNQVDNLTQWTNSEILKAQKAASLSASVGGKIFVPLSKRKKDGEEEEQRRRRAMALSKPFYGNELRNFRRMFLKWTAGHPMEDGTGDEEIVGAYISYIETHM
mmetsp:Transcript_9622/g.16798  ORF Transcript_9622/g.16798 Transcript_9622/m.16798 type:complete len:494 (-) Transcript_9622:71-1552(-)